MSATQAQTQNLKDGELIQALKTKVECERLLAVEILELLQQVQDRLLHLKMGYPSLLAFCVQELKYAESTAYRRISALRLSSDVPELKEQLQSGELTFQAVAQVQTFLNQEKKQNQKVYSLEEKQDLVKQVQQKNTRQIEQLLAEKSPGLAKPETYRQVTPTLRQVTLMISAELDAKLEDLRSLYSHKNPNPSLAELIEIMADEILKRQEDRQQRAHKRFAAKPQSQQARARNFSNEKSLRQRTSENGNSIDASNPTQATQISCPPSSTHSHQGRSSFRYISATVRYELRMRYSGRCCYVDSLTGQRCESRHQLEVEHILPVAHGGSNDIANLRLTCRNHNVYYAAQAGLAWHGPLRTGAGEVHR